MAQVLNRTSTFDPSAPVFFQSPVDYAPAAGLNVQFGADIQFNGNKVHGVGTPTASGDAANKSYVDAVIAGGGVAWGGITGDIPDQADLQAALDAKQDIGAGTTGLVSGGGVTWTGNLDFTVAAATYRINGVEYTSAQTDVSLTAADTTDDRIDIIAVDDSGTVIVIDGTPGGPPSAPYVDPATQLQLTFVYVPANATIPGGAVNEDIYHEDAEYTMSTNAGGAIDLNSTNNPHAGSVDIEGTATASGNNFTATKVSGTLNLDEWQSLVFYIRSKATWANKRAISIFWLNGSTPVGATVALSSGVFGFDSSVTSGYQVIVIPASAFATGGAGVNKLRFQVAGSGGAIGWYIDDIILQTSNGGQTPVGGDFSTNTDVSVANEILLFADTTGKLGKRATGSGIAKLTNGVLGFAVSSTDYAPASSGSSILAGNGSGGLSNVVVGSGLSFSGGTLSSTVSPSALTKTDDTNVTLTLGGTPSTALLAGVSLTLGWTGLLSVARGGTGAATSAAHTYFGNNTGSTAAPGFHQIDYSELSGTPTIPTVTPRGIAFGSAKADGISTGKLNGYFTVPFNGTITGWSLNVDSGTVTVKFWKKAAGTAVPTVSDNINTSGVSLSSGTHVRSTTVTDFTTTAVTAGDIIAVNISALTGTITDFSGSLEITPS